MSLLKFLLFRCVFEAVFKIKISSVFIIIFSINSMICLGLVILFVWIL
jgi:hypothetical protein